jgi:hypothetical protein
VAEQQACNVDVAAQQRELERRLSKVFSAARLRAEVDKPPALALVPYRRRPCKEQRKWIRRRAGAGCA